MNSKVYTEGTDMSGLNRLKDISNYNSNYYVNGNDLLYAKSDDDNTTEWYLINGSSQPIYLGYTYTYENDLLLHKGVNT